MSTYVYQSLRKVLLFIPLHSHDSFIHWFKWKVPKGITIETNIFVICFLWFPRLGNRFQKRKIMILFEVPISCPMFVRKHARRSAILTKCWLFIGWGRSQSKLLTFRDFVIIYIFNYFQRKKPQSDLGIRLAHRKILLLSITAAFFAWGISLPCKSARAENIAFVGC